MRVGRLTAALGILKADELPARALEALGREVEAFLRAGGGFTWDDWSAMTPEEKEVAEQAGDRVARQRAALSGLATLGPREAQAVAEDLTAEDIEDHDTLLAAVAEAAS